MVNQPGRPEGHEVFEDVILVMGESAVQSAVVGAREEIGHESRRRIAASLEIFGQGRVFRVERRHPIDVQIVMPATGEHGRV